MSIFSFQSNVSRTDSQATALSRRLKSSKTESQTIAHSRRSKSSMAQSQTTAHSHRSKYSPSQNPNLYNSIVVNSNAKVILEVKNIQEIGSGTFAKVYSSSVKRLRTEYSIDDGKSQELAIKKGVVNEQERKIHSFLSGNHRYIISLKYHCYSRNDYGDVEQCLIMELMPESLYSLLQRLRNKNLTLPSEKRHFFMCSLLSGLNYMHNNGIGHRDIKSHNILVDIDENLIKIADFGCAEIIKPGSMNKVDVGTRYYRAPELLCRNPKYNLSIDVWSMAIVFMDMILFDAIFKGENDNDQLMKIFQILGVPNEEEQEILSCRIESVQIEMTEKKLHSLLGLNENDKLLLLLHKMLSYNFNTRISARDSFIYITGRTTGN